MEAEKPGNNTSARSGPVARSVPNISIDSLGIYYSNERALSEASLEVGPGRLMALVGPSGCGKTSLLRSVNRLTDALPGCRVEGRILVGEMDVLDGRLDLQLLRRRVGMLFQQPNPFPLSVAENIRFPLREHGVRARSERNDRMEEALRQVGLWQEVKNRLSRPALSLSGGQQQRLCLARTLALQPEVLLLDEPCSALDPMASEVVETLIASLRNDFTILMVTHNLAQARRLADDVTVCWADNSGGCVLETGTCESIFLHSTHPVTRAYCGGEKG